jgi:hypothetical protein
MLKINNSNYKYKNINIYIYNATQKYSWNKFTDVPLFALYVATRMQTSSLVSNFSIQEDQARLNG